MSGGGKIIEKAPGKNVVRYLVMSEYRLGWFDETFVNALPAEDEPALGDTIWWGGGNLIYWGENDSKNLVKVGFSWSNRP